MSSVTKEGIDEIRQALRKKKHSRESNKETSGAPQSVEDVTIIVHDDGEEPLAARSLNVRHVTIHSPQRDPVRFEFETGRKSVVKFRLEE